MEDKNIHTLKDFSEHLAESIEHCFYEDYGLSVSAEAHPVMKTNIEKQGITVRFDGSHVAPTVYVDDAFKEFESGDIAVTDLVKQFCDSIYMASKHTPELPELNPKEAKKHITLTLINTCQNERTLERTPHAEILNGELSAIPRWYISDEASFIVTNELAAQIGLTPDEVIQIGMQNINSQQYTAKSMQEILAEMTGGNVMDMMPPAEGPQMIVLTSSNRIQGANALLSEETLNNVHDMIGDYCILPSSIFEVICMPISEELNPKEMREMVRDINLGQVAPEERLSDQIFKYDGKKLTVVGDSFSVEAPQIETAKMETHTIRMAM